jgi:hypothetical protein
MTRDSSFSANKRITMRLSVLRPACVLVSLAVWLGGCGGEKEQPTAPVRGLVTLDGKPLAGGTVAFEPDVRKGNTSKHEFRAAIDPAHPGVYELQSDRAGVSDGEGVSDAKGVSLGWYRVAIFAVKPSEGMTRPVWLADQRYSDVETSGLAVEVVANPSKGAYDFDLKRGGPR